MESELETKNTDQTNTKDAIVIEDAIVIQDVPPIVKVAVPVKEEPKDTSWWSYLKKQTEFVTEQYHKEVSEIVSTAKSDAQLLQTQFQHLQTSLTPLSQTIQTTLTPLTQTIQTTYQTTVKSAQTIQYPASLKSISKKADSVLTSVERKLEGYETMITEIGKEFVDAFVREGNTENIIIDPLILSMQSDPMTYTTDPIDTRYPSYKTNFSISQNQPRIDVLKCSTKVIALFNTRACDENVFWARYFFKEMVVCESVERRKRVLESVGTDVVQLSWDDEDESPVDDRALLSVKDQSDNGVVESVKVDTDISVKDESLEMEGRDEAVETKVETFEIDDVCGGIIEKESINVPEINEAKKNSDDWDEWE